MHNNYQFIIPTNPTEDGDLPVVPLNVNTIPGSSFVTPPYALDTDFDPLNLFPDLPATIEENSSRVDLMYNNNGTRKDRLAMPWDFNEFDIDLMPLTSSLSLTTKNNLDESPSSNHNVSFQFSERLRVQQEWQQSQQHEQPNNENDWNFLLIQNSFVTKKFHEGSFPSPSSVTTTLSVEASDPDQIILPESSKSAPLLRKSPPNNTCNRYRKQQQRRTGGILCHICNKPFGRSQEVKRHLMIHTGSKKFKCSVCEFLFLRKDTLDRHMKTLAGRCGERRPSSSHSSVE